MTGWIVASVLAGCDAVMVCAIVILIRHCERLMRTISDSYRVVSDHPDAEGSKHYSLYKPKGDNT